MTTGNPLCDLFQLNFDQSDNCIPLNTNKWVWQQMLWYCVVTMYTYFFDDIQYYTHALSTVLHRKPGICDNVWCVKCQQR